MTLQDLQKPFPTDKIRWRIGRKKADKTAAMFLAYIDARDLYQRLDEVCGMHNWQIRYPHAGDKVTCEIGIRIDGEWVWKANGAGDTNIEGDKGAYSDAAKRAGVPWGICSYLYDLKNVWADLNEAGYMIPADQYKLDKAHDALVAKITGVKTKDNAPPKPFKPMDSKEFELLLEQINICELTEELNSAKELAEAAWKRMDKQQQDSVADCIEAKSKSLEGQDEIPI